MAILQIQSEYGYVVMTAASTFFLGFWHGYRVGMFRKAAGPQVTYPTAYADSAMMSSASAESKQKLYLFNCAQRAHGNYLENQPSVVAALLISGLQYPVVTSVMGVGWVLSRIAFAIGYTNPTAKDGKGRLIGLPQWIFQISLFVMTGMTGYKMAFA